LLRAARDANVIEAEADQYGKRYVIDFELTRNDRRAAVPQRLDPSSRRRFSTDAELLCTIELGTMPEIELLSAVALLEDVPEKNLMRGQVGTVVESLASGVYEVEFSDDSGRTYASLALGVDQLMRLHHEPAHQAA
jgi:hypothetical protein